MISNFFAALRGDYAGRLATYIKKGQKEGKPAFDVSYDHPNRTISIKVKKDSDWAERYREGFIKICDGVAFSKGRSVLHRKQGADRIATISNEPTDIVIEGSMAVEIAQQCDLAGAKKKEKKKDKDKKGETGVDDIVMSETAGTPAGGDAEVDEYLAQFKKSSPAAINGKGSKAQAQRSDWTKDLDFVAGIQVNRTGKDDRAEVVWPAANNSVISSLKHYLREELGAEKGGPTHDVLQGKNIDRFVNKLQALSGRKSLKPAENLDEIIAEISGSMPQQAEPKILPELKAAAGYIRERGHKLRMNNEPNQPLVLFVEKESSTLLDLGLKDITYETEEREARIKDRKTQVYVAHIDESDRADVVHTMNVIKQEASIAKA